ncbi:MULTISPECIES: hypothetical protein [unclassified Caballeronia]|uniref:hypothetical protein n=1 Tax=unclassified Caballeronia TaxID=2646786 RepID=UPI002859D7D6|nr:MULTISPECIES: hypothetical protein [unclassified Caballeronia]MDR5776874.1 hypothetical protein [Caballeronia sp. LZ002]MDR5798820.1 hypothetical protein [Caballeronia sp. LZ001]MDR5852341.1 hypothetical protein [Caballeronia sp. LZ003]
MFSTKRLTTTSWPRRAVCFGALVLVTGLSQAQESHLSLDDIDKLARQKLVDSMRKTDGAGSGGVGLGSPLGAAAQAPVTVPAPVPVKVEHKPALAPKRVIPVSFVGAYSDMSGAYVLYDYQGTTYTARQGSRLLNGWTVASVNGFEVSLADGKRKWTENISAPVDTPVALADSPSVRAITDLGSPLPPGGLASAAPSFVPFAK